jgi:hypothetical protein
MRIRETARLQDCSVEWIEAKWMEIKTALINSGNQNLVSVFESGRADGTREVSGARKPGSKHKILSATKKDESKIAADKVTRTRVSTGTRVRVVEDKKYGDVRNDNCNLPQQKSRDIITTEVQEINNLYMPSSKKIGKIIMDKFEAVKFGDTGTKDVDAYSSEQIQIPLQLYRSKRAKRKFVLEEENNMVGLSDNSIFYDFDSRSINRKVPLKATSYPIK